MITASLGDERGVLPVSADASRVAWTAGSAVGILLVLTATGLMKVYRSPKTDRHRQPRRLATLAATAS